MESNQHPNARNSVYLGIAGLVMWVIMIGLAIVFHQWPPIILQWVAGAAIFTTSFINIKNTFETNDPWKTWVSVIAIIATILIYVIPISSHSV